LDLIVRPDVSLNRVVVLSDKEGSEEESRHHNFMFSNSC